MIDSAEGDDVMLDSSEDDCAAVAASTAPDDTASTKRRKHYSVKLKRQVLTALDTDQLSVREASRRFGVPRRTASDWVKEKEKIFSFREDAGQHEAHPSGSPSQWSSSRTWT
jgi:predicted XRE-type DNA-binding protein